MENPLLNISGLTKSFDQSGPVVNSVSFEVGKNEIFALLGPSGCGKTTTLRLIAGFEQCEAGEVYIEEELVESTHKRLSPQKREIGFVFQDYALFPHMNALENVAFGLHEVERRKRSTIVPISSQVDSSSVLLLRVLLHQSLD